MDGGPTESSKASVSPEVEVNGDSGDIAVRELDEEADVGVRELDVDDEAIDVEADEIAADEARDDPDIAVIEINALPAKAPSRGRAAPKRRAPRRRSTKAREAGAIEPELYLHRLVSLADLGKRGVVALDTPLGRLAVGVSKGTPFAVSNTCRHLFASLGDGRVTRDGCLQCPWHRSRYDVTTGQMVRGPQGMLWLTVREIARIYGSLVNPLHVYRVIERDRVLYLDTAAELD